MTTDEPTTPARPEPARVLIVEDERLVALDIQLRLEKMGHHASVASSGEDALARVAEAPCDVVLMDIKLEGELDGIETARQIRSHYDVPIVYLTAYADNQTLERARATEPYGYVLKPFQERELKAAIEMTLERHTNDRRRSEQHQLQRFLADASAHLATSLDYHAVAIGASNLLIPSYADWCSIHLRKTNDLVPPFVYSCPGPPEVVARDEPGPMISAIEARGTPELVNELPEGAALAAAFGEAESELLNKLEARSMICVPLMVHGQLVGSLALIAGGSRPRYTVDDLSLAEDFAQRLSAALDNALRYRAANHAIRTRDDVMAIVSHDLRTPLATIAMQTEAFTREGATAKPVASIRRAVHQMNRLIGDLLDASAINAGHMTLELGECNAANLGREVTDIFRPHAEARQITLLSEMPAEPLRIVCDRDRIVQVLSNLISNAIKFTPHGGTVGLRVLRSGRCARFEVDDTGPGIPPHQLQHLFERFWRGQGKRNGAGLGLFIARGIIAAHGSHLEVESWPGTGSRFHFELAETGPR